MKEKNKAIDADDLCVESQRNPEILNYLLDAKEILKNYYAKK